MRYRARMGQQGFTLIELLIVVAIIGLLAAMLIPNLLDAMQKAKQKKAMADIRFVGTAAMSWLTDQSAAGAAGATANDTLDIADYPAISHAELRTVLVPQYLQTLPTLDGWKVPYDYRLDRADPASQTVVCARSFGRDLVADGDSYGAGAFDPTDYDRDLVWADGFFVRWPQRAN